MKKIRITAVTQPDGTCIISLPDNFVGEAVVTMCSADMNRSSDGEIIEAQHESDEDSYLHEATNTEVSDDSVQSDAAVKKKTESECVDVTLGRRMYAS